MSDHGSNILVVDDEKSVLDSLAGILAPEGLAFRGAGSAGQALEIARETRPGVILLDTRLPDGDPLELLDLLHQFDPEVQIIMLSEPRDHELILDALERGARDYLAKPLHPRETRLAVQRALKARTSSLGQAHLHRVLGGVLEDSQRMLADAAGAFAGNRLSLFAQGIVDAAASALGAGKASLMLLDEPGNWLRVEACAGHGVPPGEMDVVLPGEGVAGFALTAGEPFVVADARADFRFRNIVIPERYQGHSFVLVPLVVADRPIGVLCASESLDGKPFNEESLVVLQLLGQQFLAAREAAGRDPAGVTEVYPLLEGGSDSLSSAPAGTDWLDALEVLPKLEAGPEPNRDAELAREICRAVTDELAPEKMLARALKSLGSRLSAAPVSLYLADPNSGELKLECMTNETTAEDRTRLPLAQGLTGRAVAAGTVVAQACPQQDPEFEFDVDTPKDGIPRPLLFLPIAMRGRVIGVVRAFLREGVSVSSRTGEVAAAALSAAVRNVLLYRSLVSSIEEIAEARRAARS